VTGHPPAYQPMANDRRDFDPMSAEWAYILDDGCRPPCRWRELVPARERVATWPFEAAGRHRDNSPYYGARLAPDWAFYAWGSEYALAGWRPGSPHEVFCHIGATRAAPGPERGRRAGLYVGYVHLDLRGQTVRWAPCRADAERGVPEDVNAEAEHKGRKLLAYFADACARWQRGEAQPVTARDLYEARKGASA
jgi:hypothetical protein